MQGAKVRVSASLRKSVLIDRASVGQNSSVTVHVIRGTKLAVGRARHAVTASYTMHSSYEKADRLSGEVIGQRWKFTGTRDQG